MRGVRSEKGGPDGKGALGDQEGFKERLGEELREVEILCQGC